ncbi:MAG TPA: peptidoglycan DD-metalloendopeptidase family protein [Candidatus Binatia bacterium]|nr:peptidoglycan DD-metalloendopeptidase family protein [Candidatus Binatia bacterium]
MPGVQTVATAARFESYPMRVDYSPAPVTAPTTGRRSFLVAALVLVSVGSMMTQRGVLKSPQSAPESTPLDLAADAAAPSPAIVDPWVTVTVRPGQTLSQIFDQERLPAQDWMRILALGGDARRLLTLRAGQQLQIRKDGAGLQELVAPLDELRTLQISRTDRGFEAISIAADIERRPTFATGTITSTLWDACQGAGLTENACIRLSDVFGYDVDFGRDIRVGDRFAVIHEDLYKNGERLREGDILAAEFVNQGHSMRAVRYMDPQGNIGYYTPEGQALRKQFTKAPLDFFRITSGFSSARWHPILNVMRAHRGVDYAAPAGSPIKATGSGRIEFMGWKGGYGRVLMLRHGDRYETVYGHLSRFRSGLGVGSRVKIGDVIGYVGMSGLATAPHVHYEFRVNGKHVDPRRVVLPRADAMPRQYVDNFRAAAAPLFGQLDALDRSRAPQVN